jgi:uncharacterized protein YbjT (DUF2867 family)
MNVLVTGGTGLLGRHVVSQLNTRGHTTRILSRNTVTAETAEVFLGDLLTGKGLDRAVDGVETVVHCASDPRNFDVDLDGTRRLLDAARGAGVSHLVYISIVGIELIPWPYYSKAKLGAEQLIKTSGMPWTILRTTQFHEFTVEMLRRFCHLPIVAVPRGWRLQPVDVREVAARLVTAVETGPAGYLPDLGGPDVMTMADAARSLLRARGRRQPVVEVHVPGRFSASWRGGATLAPENRAGESWQEFLDRFASATTHPQDAEEIA